MKIVRIIMVRKIIVLNFLRIMFLRSIKFVKNILSLMIRNYPGNGVIRLSNNFPLTFF